MNMLKKIIELKEFQLRQVWRENDLAIYEQHEKDHETQAVNEEIWGYEVIIIEIMPMKIIGSTNIPEHEIYPKGEDWGIRAWTTISLKAAQARVRIIKERRYEIANLII